MKTNILNESSKGTEVIRLEDKLFDQGEIYMTEEVNAESCATLIQQFHYLDGLGLKEVVLYINSPGGAVDAGLAVYDTMIGMKTPVRTVCIGTAASMGSILFLAGRKREVLEHSFVMLHDPLANLSGTKRALSLEKEAARLMETREILGRIIAERTGHTLDEVYEKTKDDCFFSAKEALEFGIATKIIRHV